MSATVIRARDSEDILVRNAAKIKPGRKSNLMFHENARTAPDTTFGRAVSEMFEITGQKDDYYHYYVATGAFDHVRFVAEVMPELDRICVPSRCMTWEEFEQNFHNFEGGTCRINQHGTRGYDATVVIRELHLIEHNNGHMLWIGVPEGQELVTALMDFESFSYKGKEFKPREGIPIPYDPLWRGESGLGLVPFDEHDGSIGLADCNFGITFYPPDH